MMHVKNYFILIFKYDEFFLSQGYLLSMSSVPSLIPFMPELSVKLRIKINYHQFNAVIPNTQSFSLGLN